MGSVMMTVPMYMSEIGDNRMRGVFGTLFAVAMVSGSIASYAIGPCTSRTTFSAVGAIAPIIFAVIFAWVPETPIYYAMKNLPHKVEKSLVWLRGTSDVADEVTQAQYIAASHKNHAGTAMQLLTERGSRKVGS